MLNHLKLLKTKKMKKLILLLLIVSASIEIEAQENYIQCFTDSAMIYSGPESAFVSSTFGGIFTPKGELRILLIFAGFTNDGNTISTGVNWPYNDGVRPPGESFPLNINDYFYTNSNQFNINNTDNSLSNYYYQMSYSSGNPLKLIADVFPYRVNVTADIITDTTGGLPFIQLG